MRLISAVFFFLFALPNVTVGAEAEQTELEVGHPVIAFGEGMRAILNQDKEWRICGNYFAHNDSLGERIIYFNVVEEEAAHINFRFIFTTLDRLSVWIAERPTAPRVLIWGEGSDATFIIRMSAADHTASLPCLK